MVVRWNSALFHNRNVQSEEKSLFEFPNYRMIFAVGTLDASVFIYDTEKSTPFLLVRNLHYASITDLSWHNSADGKDSTLMISSIDGFVSIIKFEDFELGRMLDSQETLKIISDRRIQCTPKTTTTKNEITPLQADFCVLSTSNELNKESPLDKSALFTNETLELNDGYKRRRIAPILISENNNKIL